MFSLVDQSKAPKARPVVLSVFQTLFRNCRFDFTCFSHIVSLFVTSSISVSGSRDEQKEPLINKTSRRDFFLIFSLFLSDDNLHSDRCFRKALFCTFSVSDFSVFAAEAVFSLRLLDFFLLSGFYFYSWAQTKTGDFRKKYLWVSRG